MISIKSLSAVSCRGPRPNQEDFIIAPSESDNRIFVLCDGMGGHGHGEVASSTVAEAVYQYLTQLNLDCYAPADLQDAVNFALKQLAEADVYDDQKAMGTTLVVVVFNKTEILIGHIGDSRCYLFSTDGIKKFRSVDHSLVQEGVQGGIITEEEAWNHPKKNIITRSITSKTSSVKIEVDTLTVSDNDILMLCSDGVSDTLKDDVLQSFTINKDVDEIASAIQTECELNAKDNFSFILIALSQDEPAVANPLPEPIVIPDPIVETSQCAYCHSIIPAASTFCSNCGHTVGRLPKPKPGPRPISRGVSYLWLGVGVLTGILISTLIVCMWPDSDTSPKPHYDIPRPDNTVQVPINLHEGYIDENCITQFIKEITTVNDSVGGSDTVISKKLIGSKYEDFLQQVHQKNSPQ
ncbi:MAG: serine/threonine-protein phosphatase [Muribaculaceae bacterium]|nr:serine/threonine-protein phosphatase [Muribaculaceae bacterium]